MEKEELMLKVKKFMRYDQNNEEGVKDILMFLKNPDFLKLNYLMLDFTVTDKYYLDLTCKAVAAYLQKHYKLIFDYLEKPIRAGYVVAIQKAREFLMELDDNLYSITEEQEDDLCRQYYFLQQLKYQNLVVLNDTINTLSELERQMKESPEDGFYNLQIRTFSTMQMMDASGVNSFELGVDYFKKGYLVLPLFYFHLASLKKYPLAQYILGLEYETYQLYEDALELYVSMLSTILCKENIEQAIEEYDWVERCEFCKGLIMRLNLVDKEYVSQFFD